MTYFDRATLFVYPPVGMSISTETVGYSCRLTSHKGRRASGSSNPRNAKSELNASSTTRALTPSVSNSFRGVHYCRDDATFDEGISRDVISRTLYVTTW